MDPQPDGSEVLPAREREVLQLLACGDLYKEIAEHLGTSIPTVNSMPGGITRNYTFGPGPKRWRNTPALRHLPEPARIVLRSFAPLVSWVADAIEL
jgi:hypothetical protein